MAERIEQKRIRLSELIACGEYEGYFVQWHSESRNQFTRRLFSKHPGEDGTVAVYMVAVEKGDSFPPVIVARLNDELTLLDGWQRCAAAAILNHKTISAVIFNVTSHEEEDLISDLAFEFSEAGMPWTKAVRLIRTQLDKLAAPTVKA